MALLLAVLAAATEPVASAANMDVAVIKTANPTNAAIGDTVVYRVVATNLNTANSADALVIRDLLPPQITYVGYGASAGTYVPGTGLWSVGNLAKSTSRQLVITGLVNSAANGYVTNVATFNTSTDTDTNPNNNGSTALVYVAQTDLGIGKAADVAKTNEGGTVVFTLSVTNFGPVAATAVKVTDILPPGLVYAGDSGGGAYVSSSGVWTVGSLAVSEVKTLSITGTVGAGIGGQTIQNVASITFAGQADTNTANQSASASIQVAGADLAIFKQANPERPTQGSNLVFTITVTNAGPDTATNVVVSEPITFGVTYVSHSVSQGSYSPFSGAWEVGSLVMGASATLSLTTTVSNGEVIRNTATIILSSQPDSVTSNNSAAEIIRPFKVFPAGAAIIDMGVTPQTPANGLKPYGLIHDLTVLYHVPVWWIIDGTKTSGTDLAKVDTYDVVITGKQYKGGPFVIEEDYIPLVKSVIDSWVAQGVRVDFNLPQFTAPVYDKIVSFPNAVLDEDNGPIIEAAFYDKIGGGVLGSYIIGTPADLNLCDDIYALPHASPEDWTDASQYKTKLLEFVLNGGYLWVGCHAVSSIETLVDVNGDGVGDLNFLTDNGLWPDALVGHANNSKIYPMPHDASLAGHPYMQFMGTAAEAISGGAEDVYLLRTNSEWRATTSVGIWDPNQADLLAGTTHGKAALLAWGRAFGNPDYGMVMYEGSHSFSSGTEAQDTAAARIYGNFLLEAGLRRRAQVTSATFPTVLDSDSGNTFFFSVNVSGGTPPYRFAWSSSGGGVFSNPDSSSTYFTVPVVSEVTETLIRMDYVDACGRDNYYTALVTIYPPGGLKLTKQADKTFVQPGGQITYQLGLDFTNMNPIYLENARVEDPIPSNTTYVTGSATTNGTYSVTSNRLTWILGSSTAAVDGVYLEGTNVVLTATNDTYISSLNTAANYGSLTNLMLRRIPTEVTHGLLHFTLPPIPSNAVIATARLKMFAQTYGDGQTFVVFALTPAGPWTELGATWLSRNGVNAWGSPGGDYASATPYATLAPTGGNSFASADITALIHDWVVGTHTNYGLLIQPLGLNGTTTFSSSENAVAARRPQLELFYYNLRTETELRVLPTVAANGSTVTVTMTVSGSGIPELLTNDVTVTPPAALTIDATGDASAVLVEGPSPASVVVPLGGGTATFTYRYRVTAGRTPSTLIFRGTPTSSDPSVTLPEGKSNNSLVAPPLQFTVSVPTNVSQSVTQTFNQASFQGIPGFVGSNTIYSDMVTVTVVHASFTVTKRWTSPGGRPAAVGEPLGYDIAISNSGKVALGPIAVTDVFDPGIASYVSAVPSPDSVGGSSIQWTNLGPLAVGGVTNLTVNLLAVGSTGSGSSTNLAIVLASLPLGMGDLPPKTGAAPYRVTAPGATLIKTVIQPTNRPAAIGEQVVFRITATNTGDVALNTVPLTDVFNTNLLAIVSQTPPANSTNLTTGTLFWNNLGTLAVGGATSVLVRFTALTNGIGTNVVVTAPSTTNSIPVPPSTNEVPHTNVNPRVSIEKALTSPAGRPTALGETNVFTITVSNIGNYPLDTVPVVDTYDTTLMTYLGAEPASVDDVNDGTLNWSDVGPLPVGASTQIVARFLAVQAGTGTNVVVTTPSTTNNVPVPGATNEVPHTAVLDDLGLVKRVTQPVGRPAAIGETVEFTITVTNRGPSPVLVVPLVDRFNTNLLGFVSASPVQTSWVGDTLTWANLGTLGIGGSTVVTSRFVAVTNGIGTNYVITTGTTNDVPHTNVNPRVSIEKALTSPAGRPTALGETNVFTITVSNIGNYPLDTVPVVDTYDTTLMTYLGAEPASVDDVNDGTLNWSNVGPLGVGASTQIVARFLAVKAGTGTNVVVTTPSTTNNVPVPGATNEVPHTAVLDDLGLVKRVTQPVGRPAAIGETVEFTITVTNKGPSPVLVVPLVDRFNTNLLSFSSASPVQTTWVGDTLTWANLGTLGIGGSTVVTSRFVAVTNGIGTNYVITTGTTNEVPHTNVNPRVSIAKVLTSPSGRPTALGETNVFTITVSNIGNYPLDTVPVVDTYDTALMTYLGAEPASVDNVNDGTLNWSNVGPLGVGASTQIVARFLAVKAGTGTNVVVTTPSTTNNVPVPGATNEVPHTAVLDDLGLVKRVTQPVGRPAAIGETVEFTITVTNKGPSPVLVVPLVDRFNTNLLGFVSASPVQTTWVGDTLTWANLGTLGIGGSTVVTSRFVAVTNGIGTNYVITTGTTNDVPHTNVNPRVSIEKALTSPAGRPTALGETNVFTITVSNIGNYPLDTVPVVDTYDTTLMTYLGAEPASVDNVNDGTLNWSNVGPLGVGASTQIVARFLAVKAGTGTNVVVTTPSTTNNVPVPGATNEVPHTAVLDDLGLVKRVTQPVGRPAAIGETVEFTITVTNKGPSPVLVVPLVDRFNTNLLGFVSASPVQTTWVGDTLTWANLGTLGIGGSTVVTSRFVAVTNGIGTNYVITTGTTNDVPHTNVNPRVSIEKALTSPAGRPTALGETNVFTITVSNIGNYPLDTVPVVDTYDTALMTYLGAEPASVDDVNDGTLNWADVGPLPVGASTQIVARFLAVKAGTGTNVVVTTPSTTNNVPVPGATNEVPHTAVLDDLGLVKRVTQPVGRPAAIGETVEFTITVTNRGPSPVLVVPLVDRFNTNLLSFSSASPVQTTWVGDTLTWANLGTLGIGGSTVVTSRFVAVTNGIGTNYVITTGTTNDVPHTNVNPRVAIEKALTSPAGRPTALGETNVFTITVSNIGNYPLDTVPVVDTYDTALMTYLGAEPASVDDVNDGTLNWVDVGPLPVGASTQIVARFLAVKAGTGTNVVVTTPSTTNNVPVPGATNEVPHTAVLDDLGLVKRVTQPVGRPAAIGETVEFTITVTNKGPSPVLVVPLVDRFNTNLLSFSSASPVQTTWVGDTLTWANLGTLGIGGSTVVTSRFVAVTNGIGTNYVITTGTTNDVPHTNVNPRVHISKEVISPVGVAAQIGEVVAFRIAVSNIGNVVLDTVPVADTYDTTFLTYVSAIPPTEDNVDDGILNWTNVGPLAPGESTNLIATFKGRAGTPTEGETNIVVTAPSTTNAVPVPPATGRATYHVDESVDIDNVSTGAFKFVASGSVTHEVLGQSTNHLLLAGISVNNTPEARGTITSVMYGPTPMIQAGVRTNDDKVVSIWVLKDPPVGTTNVAVRFNRAPGEGWVVGVMTLRNVDQTIPYGAFSSSIGPSGDPAITALASAPGELVVGVVALQNSNVTVTGSGHIQRWRLSSPPAPPGYATGGGGVKQGAASVDMFWTAPGNAGTWAMGALAVRPHKTAVKAASQTGLQSSLNPAQPGAPVTFTATVTGAGPSPSGTVQFRINGAIHGSPVPLAGGQAQVTVSNLASGVHTISAQYSGDANFSGSMSPDLMQTIEALPTVAITAIHIQNGHPVIEWPGTASWNFTVEITPSLLPVAVWSNLTGYVNVPGVNGPMMATDTNDYEAVRFYRVRMTN